MSRKPDTHEPHVSATYREIATETAPAHLDRKVLEAARAASRTRYGRARAWMRPLAWAATIALSFAFALQLTWNDEMPVMEETSRPADRTVPAPDPERSRSDVHELRETSGEAVMKAKELNRQAVSQAPARSVPETAPMTFSDRAVTTADFDGLVTCDALARASAADWYECIEALREQGLVEAAEAELEALRTEFPDFQIPVSN